LFYEEEKETNLPPKIIYYENYCLGKNI